MTAHRPRFETSTPFTISCMPAFSPHLHPMKVRHEPRHGPDRSAHSGMQRVRPPVACGRHGAFPRSREEPDQLRAARRWRGAHLGHRRAEVHTEYLTAVILLLCRRRLITLVRGAYDICLCFAAASLCACKRAGFGRGRIDLYSGLLGKEKTGENITAPANSLTVSLVYWVRIQRFCYVFLSNAQPLFPLLHVCTPPQG